MSETEMVLLEPRSTLVTEEFRVQDAREQVRTAADHLKHSAEAVLSAVAAGEGWPAALSLCKEAASLMSDVGQAEGQAKTQFNLGIALFMNGLKENKREVFEEAAAAAKRSAAFFIEWGDVVQAAEAYLNEGAYLVCVVRRGGSATRAEEARELFAKAEKIFLEHGRDRERLIAKENQLRAEMAGHFASGRVLLERAEEPYAKAYAAQDPELCQKVIAMLSRAHMHFVAAGSDEWMGTTLVQMGGMEHKLSKIPGYEDRLAAAAGSLASAVNNLTAHGYRAGNKFWDATVRCFDGVLQDIRRALSPGQVDRTAKTPVGSEVTEAGEGTGIPEEPDAVETGLDPRGDFAEASALDRAKARLLREASANDVAVLTAALKDAQENPPADKAGFVQDMRRMLCAAGLELRLVGSSATCTVTVSRGALAVSVSGRGPVGFRNASLELTKARPLKFTPRASRAKSNRPK